MFLYHLSEILTRFIDWSGEARLQRGSGYSDERIMKMYINNKITAFIQVYFQKIRWNRVYAYRSLTVFSLGKIYTICRRNLVPYPHWPLIRQG
jgi:hypothetical protein